MQIPYPQILNTQKIATDLYGIDIIPETILFAPDGTIIAHNIYGEELKEKLEEYMTENDLKKEDLWINVVNGYHKLTHHGELPIKFQPIYTVKETDQYKTMLEKQPRVYIGPQQYWKMPKETFSRGKQKKPNLSSITDDSGRKVYFMDRKKTDKRVFSAGMRKAVY